MFRVTSEILRVAHGQVRCGRCQTQFDALERLIEEADDGSIERGRYMRPPRGIPQPPPPPGQIDVDEPVEHEDITLEGRHIEISGVYEAIDESGQGEPQIREEVIEEWVEFDQDDVTIDTDPGVEVDAQEQYASGDVEQALEEEFVEEDADDDDQVEEDLVEGDFVEQEQDEDIRAAAEELEQEHAASRSGRWAASAPHTELGSRRAREAWAGQSRRQRQTRAAAAVEEPDFDFPMHERREPTPVIWRILPIPLILLLLVQVVHHYRADLARHPQIGAPLQSLYAALGLTLRPDWNLHAYEVRQWGVVADPSQPGTLKVRASVKNLADFPQPYPLLKLVLEDRWGDQVRAREFEPSEYLDPTIAPDRMLAPAQQTNASIAIVDPGPDAEGFRFDVCLRGARGPVCAADVPGRK
jgi:predicted Zn finger-like uncharacterized protein